MNKTNQPKPQKTLAMRVKDILRPIYHKVRAIFLSIINKPDFVPSGHFYSPIANAFEINEGIKSINFNPSSLKGIDLRLDKQLALLEIFKGFYKELPFKEERQPHLRYYFNNQAYCHSDGICLYAMIRHFCPKRIIEVGSGFSSALMHDVNELFFSASNKTSNNAFNKSMGGTENIA